MRSDPEPRAAVAVRPAAAIAARPRLFAALEEAFPISFGPDLGPETRALLDFGADAAPGPGHDRLPMLMVGPGSESRGGEECLLASSPSIDQRVRRISVTDPLDGPALETGSADEVLAATAAGPTWVRAAGPRTLHRVRSSLPELGASQPLRSLFAERPVVAIALVQFLRELTEPNAPATPKVRATILFDDPNLRWRTYGFIDFRRLLEHADANGYHAAMAMIPLDGRLQHRATVDLFRRRPDRLSLVLHGNNHVAKELLQPMADADALAIAAQAMRRAAGFESRYGLRMDRVMTPPHGMCAENMAAALGSLGFDALCAIHPYPWAEQPPADRPLAGWDPAEFAGCPVIPRVHFSERAADIALRAFMGHPLVIYGHHEDLADGLEPLAEIAALVESLGDVRWSSLGEIAASNYTASTRDSVLCVRAYSQRLRLELEPGVGAVSLRPPRDPAHGFAGWSVDGSATIPFDSVVASGPGPVEVRLTPTAAVDPSSVRSPSPPVWPMLRRVATETRDRLRPLIATSAN